MLQLETETLGARSSALVGAPIAVHSALSRQGQTSIMTPSTNRPSVLERDDDDDAGAPDWPPAEVEAAMSAEVAQRDAGSAPRRRSRQDDVETLDGGPLPELSEMLKMIPATVQEQLDELFRAKFMAVRRVPAAVLKVNQTENKPAAIELADDDSTAPVEEADDD